MINYVNNNTFYDKNNNDMLELEWSDNNDNAKIWHFKVCFLRLDVLGSLKYARDKLVSLHPNFT
mgnify:CR=1 FL=1